MKKNIDRRGDSCRDECQTKKHSVVAMSTGYSLITGHIETLRNAVIPIHGTYNARTKARRPSREQKFTSGTQPSKGHLFDTHVEKAKVVGYIYVYIYTATLSCQGMVENYCDGSSRVRAQTTFFGNVYLVRNERDELCFLICENRNIFY